MKLVWKLLRQHLSISQLAGFFFANLFGMAVVLLGIQFYNDVLPLFTAEDSFMKADFLVLNKKIATTNTINGSSLTFGKDEVDDLRQQNFTSDLGQFTSTQYKLDVYMLVNGSKVMNNSELLFESIPDRFIETPTNDWKFSRDDKIVPLILPRIYLTMYNFGFAQKHALPKISEGLVGMIDVGIFIQKDGKTDTFKGKVIGFSNRLSSILVPQSFMDWSNEVYGRKVADAPTRLIMKAKNPTDEQLSKYINSKGYEIENDNANVKKTTYFLRLIVSMVTVVGLLISILSFYILMLSIYLLLQKNSSKLENLLLIGYSPMQVAQPYSLLTVGLNFGVLLLAWGLLYVVRRYYVEILENLFPNMDAGGIWPAIMVGAALFVVISLFNQIAIYRKVMKIWKREE